MSLSPTQALFQQALALHRAGRVEDAETAYRQIIKVEPGHYPARCMLGRLRLEQGRNEDAEKLFAAAIKLDGRSTPGLAGYGLALLRTRKFREASPILRRAVAAAPTDWSARHNLADSLRGQGQLEDALAAYDDALRTDPGRAESYAGRAAALLGLDRPDEALRSCDHALSRDPRHALALTMRAQALAALHRPAEAIIAYGLALAVSQEERHLMFGDRARLLAGAGRLGEALADCTEALRLRPKSPDLLRQRSAILERMRRFEPALADADAAIALDPKEPASHIGRAVCLEALGRLDEAVQSYDRALARVPSNSQAHANIQINRTAILAQLKRLPEAIEGLQAALRIDPDNRHAYGNYAHCRLLACDWTDREALEAGLRERVFEGRLEIAPGTLLAYFDDPALQLAGARNYVALKMPDATEAWTGPAYVHDRPRIAYLSADLHTHATLHLAIELFERHDRSLFDVTAISFGQDDASDLRARGVAAFESFHDVNGASDQEIADLLRRLEIDIAVDLKGFTMEARDGVFSRRPAPLQVNYLGFAGTLGAGFYDYVLADEVIAPAELDPFFAEKIVRLPHSYQPNDSRRGAPTFAVTRAEAGLPETGFVFCCFNNNFKIAPTFFDVWMRLLGEVDGSVLWLINDNPAAMANLRREAAARGVDPARLVFAPRVGPEDHLARHRLADLFLDTLPYNAHTTASDALWMGLPMVTCLGRAFAGRVGASLCRATGLEALIAPDIAAYERLALDLARDPARLAQIAGRLEAGRLAHPLFDADLYRRGVESAFTTMLARHRAGQPPAAFSVTL